MTEPSNRTDPWKSHFHITWVRLVLCSKPQEDPAGCFVGAEFASPAFATYEKAMEWLDEAVARDKVGIVPDDVEFNAKIGIPLVVRSVYDVVEYGEPDEDHRYIRHCGTVDVLDGHPEVKEAYEKAVSECAGQRADALGYVRELYGNLTRCLGEGWQGLDWIECGLAMQPDHSVYIVESHWSVLRCDGLRVSDVAVVDYKEPPCEVPRFATLAEACDWVKRKVERESVHVCLGDGDKGLPCGIGRNVYEVYDVSGWLYDDCMGWHPVHGEPVVPEATADPLDLHEDVRDAWNFACVSSKRQKCFLGSPNYREDEYSGRSVTLAEALDTVLGEDWESLEYIVECEPEDFWS